MSAAQALRVLASLGSTRSPPWSVGGQGDPFRWLRYSALSVMQPGMFGMPWFTLEGDPDVKRMAAIDRLHRSEHLVRLSWVVLVGTIDVDDTTRTLRLPLLSRPVELRSTLGGPLTVRPIGDPELTTHVTDPAERSRLESAVRFGGGALLGQPIPGPSVELLRNLPELEKWIGDVAFAAVGRRPDAVVSAASAPPDPGRLHAIAAFGLHLARQTDVVDLRTTLLGLAGVDGLERSALGRLYRDDDDPATRAPKSDDLPTPVRTTRPLTGPQRDVVLRARTAPVTVVSGPPGTGKTHCILSVAVDAVARGETVLIATASRHATDVLIGSLADAPGPDPMAFGSGVQADELLDRIARRLERTDDEASPEQLDQEIDHLRRRSSRLADAIRGMLAAETDLVNRDRVESLLATYDLSLVDRLSDEDRVAALRRALVDARTPSSLWPWRARRRRRGERAVHAITGDLSLDDAGDLLALIDRRRQAGALAGRGGAALSGVFAELATTRQLLFDATGRREARRQRERLDRSGRASLASFGAMLRSGRARRRRMLASVDSAALLEALPLWVGTVRDVDDVLPPVARLFDLVILDEASQIDQISGAPTLSRATRALIVGDPHQLRHVSFTADEAVREACRAEKVGARLEGLLDVRRSSVFDLATAEAEIIRLRHHFRSVPQLIEFSRRAIYRGELEVMTRHPSNDGDDRIEVRRVDGRRSNGVNRAELDAVIAELRHQLATGSTSVGVMSPFRDQADAIENAILDTFSIEEIEALDLQSGTVHAFQGAERDVIILSTALDEEDSPGARRFVSNANLLNVMVTRARQRMVVITSIAGGTDLLGQFLLHAAGPLAVPESGRPADPWTATLFDDAQLAGLHPAGDYAVGDVAIDIVVGTGPAWIGCECRPHPDGPDRHIDRHLALRSMGWTLIDAFESRWHGRAPELIADLARQLETASHDR